MATGKSESLHLYQYLCNKIGTERVVRLRRLANTIRDHGSFLQITSGSKGEGLDLKGSDSDVMHIHPDFKVFESDKTVVVSSTKIPVVMDTDDTPPCFSKLRLFFENPYIYSEKFQQFFKTDCRGKYMISSELYKTIMFLSTPEKSKKPGIIHGPCLSDETEYFDITLALQCNQWISLAETWVTRSRTTWPSPNLISKIISCGVLFVPIGYKGSIHEDMQWRISFSVAEKFLIFSFSHTQLLCYALLKIILKEIVDKQEDLKGLLCSYFLKTMLFWIIEESQPSVWIPANIIPCFKACLQRLLYCIEYSTLLHYFIPDNNLFYLRFNYNNKRNLIHILSHLHNIGIHWFYLSDTLNDYSELTYYNMSNNDDIHHVKKNLETILDYRVQFYGNQFKNLMHGLLYYSRTDLSASLFTLFLSRAYRDLPHAKQIAFKTNNKRNYYMYKDVLSHLLIELQSDAVSGWVKLASFYYVHKNYLTSLDRIKYVLSKCTDEKINMTLVSENFKLSQNQKTVLKLMKREKLYVLLKHLTFVMLIFSSESSIIPSELDFIVKDIALQICPLPFVHFLKFLCYFHLQDFTSCENPRRELLLQTSFYFSFKKSHFVLYVLTFYAIACQMMGKTQLAKTILQFLIQIDRFNMTNAVSRLSTLN